MNKQTVLIWLVVTAALLALSFFPQRTVIFKDQRVTVEEKRVFWNAFLVHKSVPKYLGIYGQSFGPIRGMPPYYIEIQSIEAVLFVTESKDGDVRFILAYDHTKKITEIPAGKTGFGWNIGSGRVPGEALTDYVESADSKHTILLRRGLDWKETLNLNITEKTLKPVP